MGSTTPIVKWPFPVSSDLIAQGAVNMEQLAEATENQFWLAANKYTAEEPWSSYPVGMSMMAATSSSSGFPYSNGLVVTYRPTSANACQWFYWISSVSSRQLVQYRLGYGSGDTATWTAWMTVVGPGTPDAMAAGRVTVTPTAGEPKAVTITFPTNRFEAKSDRELYPQLTCGGRTHPENVAACVYSINETRMVAYLWVKDSTDTSLGWQVTQGVDTPAATLFSAEDDPLTGGDEHNWAICQNPNCGEYRRPRDIGPTSFTDPESGETVTPEVYCGTCGQPITEIVDVEPPTPPDTEPQPIE